MIRRCTTSLLISAVLFALVHQLASAASLYWYYWWFDILMHFWGGTLVTLVWYVFALSRHGTVACNAKKLILLLLATTILWEGFELLFELHTTSVYLFDTIKDICVGALGGLVLHAILQAYTIR
jgi:hypothetical protein